MIQDLTHLRAILAAPFAPGNDVLITPMIEEEVGARMRKAAWGIRNRFDEVIDGRDNPPPMSDEVTARVMRAVELRIRGMTLEDIAADLGVSPATAMRDLARGGHRGNGRAMNGRKKTTPPDVVESIRAMAATCTKAEIAFHHHMSVRTIGRIMADNGIELAANYGQQTADKMAAVQAARRMRERGASIKEITKELGRSDKTVRGYLRETDQ